MEQLLLNHEIWSTCPHCGGWVDLRGGECGCGRKEDKK